MDDDEELQLLFEVDELRAYYVTPSLWPYV